MPLIPVRDISESIRVKKAVREMYEAKRAGDQSLFTEQTKIQLPMITTQKETMKSLEDNIIKGQAQDTLIPLVRELQRRNNQIDMLTDQIDMLAEQPFAHSQLGQKIGLPVATSSPARQQILIDMDNKLNETDKEHLEDLGFDLPSIVHAKNSYDQAFERIKYQNKSIGQLLGKGPGGKNITESQKKIYESKRNTLVKYKEGLMTDMKASEKYFKKTGDGLKKKKRNPVDVIHFSNPDELYKELVLYCKARSAGNTGLDNHIYSILDELLKIKAISKNQYNELYKEIFKNST